MNNIKIVLTGGPCGGKTSSIFEFANKLSSKYDTIAIEETANALLRLGYLDKYSIDIIDFQNILFKIQFINEYYGELNSDILLCDRGLFDALSYINKAQFNKILKSNKIDEFKLKSTYDKALYFKTIAYDYPKLFSSKRRYETPESAVKRDIETLKIWKSKILSTKYDNTMGLSKKQEIIFSELSMYLDNYLRNDSKSLSDYYSESYINEMKNDIYEIIEINNIPNSIEKKTLELIKW